MLRWILDFDIFSTDKNVPTNEFTEVTNYSELLNARSVNEHTQKENVHCGVQCRSVPAVHVMLFSLLAPNNVCSMHVRSWICAWCTWFSMWKCFIRWKYPMTFSDYTRKHPVQIEWYSVQFHCFKCALSIFKWCCPINKEMESKNGNHLWV